MAVFSGYREVNAVNSVTTGNGKSKFVHMPNSVNTLKILVGIYFRVLYTFYVKIQYFTRVHSLQSIIQIMDQAAKRTPTHQLKALRACLRAWLQVLGLGRLLVGVPVKDPPAGTGPGVQMRALGRLPARRARQTLISPSPTDTRRVRGRNKLR